MLNGFVITLMDGVLVYPMISVSTGISRYEKRYWKKPDVLIYADSTYFVSTPRIRSLSNVFGLKAKRRPPEMLIIDKPSIYFNTAATSWNQGFSVIKEDLRSPAVIRWFAATTSMDNFFTHLYVKCEAEKTPFTKELIIEKLCEEFHVTPSEFIFETYDELFADYDKYLANSGDGDIINE